MKFLMIILSLAMMIACSSQPKRNTDRDIVFEAHDIEFLRFAPQGQVFVKGELVADRSTIWAGFLNWYNVIQTVEYKSYIAKLKDKNPPPGDPMTATGKK